MMVPNLRPPTSGLSEEEALKRMEQLRRDMPKPTPRNLDGFYVRLERCDWRRIWSELMES